MNYRRDIDGLRAVAVLSIVLYHFGASALSGGFVGVDVFFVISGFLITSLIAKDLKADRFILSDFFMRRVRRLAPALFVTIAATFVLGHYILVAIHFEELGYAAIAAVLSVSNILFWTQSGYFDIAASFKPLLHTWSLGVEEQFYLIWPACLLLLWTRTTLRRIIIAVCIVALLSLIGAIWVAQTQPETGFFLTPFRLYEFAFGVLLALTGTSARSTKAANLAAAFGLGLIGFAIVQFDQRTAFPSAAALVPCLGAALVLYAGNLGFISKLLGIWPLRFIGKISYSLYLIHWPLIVYFEYLLGPPVTGADTVVLLVIAILLATIMFYVVETPFRARRANGYLVPGKVIGFGALTCAVAVCIAGLMTDRIGVRDQGISPEIAALRDELREGRELREVETRSIRCHYAGREPDGFAERFEECVGMPSKDVIVVVGDSHAVGIYMGLRRRFPDHQFLHFTGGGCDFVDMGNVNRCDVIFGPGKKWISDNADIVRGVIYSQRAGRFLRDMDDPLSGIDQDRIAFISEFLDTYTPENVPTYFWGPRMERQPSIGLGLRQAGSRDALRALYGQQDRSKLEQIDDELAAAFTQTRTTYLSSMDALCDPECPVFTPDGALMFLDYAHWSPAASAYGAGKVIDHHPALTALFDLTP